MVQLAFTLPSPEDIAVRGFVGHTISGNHRPSTTPVDDLSEDLVQAYEQQLATVGSVDDLVATAYGMAGFKDLPAEAVVAVRRTTCRRLVEGDPETDAIISAVVVYLNWNPRELKRFVNVLRFSAAVRQEYQLARTHPDLSIYQLAKLAVLTIRWPHLRRHLASRCRSGRVMLAELEDTLRGESPGTEKERLEELGITPAVADLLVGQPELLRFLTVDPPIGSGAFRYLEEV